MFGERAIEGRTGWTNELIFLDRTDPEFTVAYSNFTDPVMRNEEYCENLQYVGTVIERYLGQVQSIRHEFRHRAVPITNERKYWHHKASPNFMFRFSTGDFKKA